MSLSKLTLRNHPILRNLDISLINEKTGEPYSIIAFVGENGCGKTTLLNEIFNYNKSEYIINKESHISPLNGENSLRSLMLRQGSLHINVMKEVGKLIDGRQIFPTNSGEDNKTTLRASNNANNNEAGLELIKSLGDKEITQLFIDGHVQDIYCSQDISVKIDGMEHGYNISSYSSGQQEILLKLKDLKNMALGTECVLLDEPETSLHPRWQKEIVNLIRLLITDSNGFTPQMFLATHSEKVLESLVKRDDALIVRLHKDNGEIECEPIDKMELCLPIPTFAELDYVIFHIPTLEYHDELLSRVANLYDVETISSIDKTIRTHLFYSKDKYGKVWIMNVKGYETKFNTLPVYIRNYFHHPKEGKEPTVDEIEKSIRLLRKIIINKNM